MVTRTNDELVSEVARLDAENRALRERLEDAEATLSALRSGEVDALVVYASQGERIYTLEGADRPYRAMIEAMQQGAAIVDRTGQILYANAAFALLLGRPLEQVIGSSLPASVAAAGPCLVDLLGTVSDGGCGRMELRFGGDEAPIPAEIVVHTLPPEDVLCVIATDLSQQRQYEDLVETKRRLVDSEAEFRRLYAEIKESERRKDEFLAMLAHELRNPLAPIRNALHLMRIESDPASARRAHDILERQTQNIVRLVDDLLDLSRIMSGKIELRRSVVTLGEVLERAIEIVRPTIDAHEQELAVSLPAGTVRVEVDPVRMAQAIGNLLSNAAKYTDRHGHIELHAEIDDASAVVRIQDSGIGIPAETLPHIFDLFVQADHAMRRSPGGLGVGLTLVRRLVEMHGGQVSASSDGPGRGSEFIVRLPIAAIADAESSLSRHERPPAPRAASRRVLVVDDNVDSAESTATLLRLWGHEVAIAYEGAKALEIAQAFEPSVVLLDIGLPGMSGLDVGRELRVRLGKKTVLVAMTGFGQEEDRRRSQLAGFDLHLTKPLEPSLLEAFVASV